MVDYWEKRVEVFGPEKAFLPLTLDKALRDDTAALENGTVGIFPYKMDDLGRQAVVYDPSKLDSTAHTRESCIRALWYFIHAALEDEDTQRHGALILATPKDVTFSQFDAKQESMIIRTLRGCVPLRVPAVHIIRPASFFFFIWPFIKVVFGKKLKNRVFMHFGSNAVLMKNLKDGFGMHRSLLPCEIGGFILYDQVGWLRKRREQGA
eukprot:CAMPEP_0119564372 /NCGR_PEP_ID=MMETSP1352-20130426/26767_1 /TAXON_ID=265584 /ORGANISM="Stauroneis constricta, Strain CCMP1120" /LENGTH=207 /DNA_ID=CAMNT_0007613125 /DNA_START=99 /DNA_END=722 /DNA_ORIENTATION=-